jgi:ATP-dependent DNA ligase
MLLRSRQTPSAFIPPCLPSPAERPPSGTGWIHEIKHDSFRLMARRDAAGVRLLTRNGHDWAARYPLIVAAVLSMGAAGRRHAAARFTGITSPLRWKICTTASVLNNS